MKKIIQGFFFQKSTDFTDDQRHSLGIASTPAMLIKKDYCRIMFSGIISTEPPEQLDELEVPGYMIDRLGLSILSNIRLLPDELYFKKMYSKALDSSVYETIAKSNEIRFSFERKGEIWIGEYEARGGWSGIAQCVIADAPAELFSIAP